MKERPITFSASMVRAVLNGTRTQTRSTRGLERINESPDAFKCLGANRSDDFIFLNMDGVLTGHDPSDETHIIKCPYGVVGDRLWVKEKWRIGAWDENRGRMCIDYADGPRTEWLDVPDPNWFEEVWIECSNELHDIGVKTNAHGNYHWEPGESPLRWRPSITMPRWASRILLEITNVRVERVQEPTAGDWVWVITFKKLKGEHNETEKD